PDDTSSVLSKRARIARPAILTLIQIKSILFAPCYDQSAKSRNGIKMFVRASLILCLLVGIQPSAVVEASAQSRLPEFLAKVSPSDLVSGADRFAAPAGNPPAAAVLAGERTVGYAFVNSDWVNSTGYSGKPIEILVGLGTDGKIAGARLMDHHEPIVLIGIPPERIAGFIKGYIGRDVLQIAT